MKRFGPFQAAALNLVRRPKRRPYVKPEEEVGLDVKIIRLLCRTPRTIAPGVYSCYLGQIVGGEIALGADPELPDDNQELHEVRWFPLEQVQEHPEVARILKTLAQLRLHDTT